MPVHDVTEGQHVDEEESKDRSLTVSRDDNAKWEEKPLLEMCWLCGHSLKPLEFRSTAAEEAELGHLERRGNVMAQFKGKSNLKRMRANTLMDQCSTPAPCNGKRNLKASSKLKKLSFIHEGADSELSSTNKLAPGGHRSLHLSRTKTTVQRNISNNKKGIEPFQNRSPGLQHVQESTQSNSKNTTCSGYTETSSEFSLTSDALPYILPSLESELLVDSSSTRTDSCSSVELFREAEEHAPCVHQEDVCWFHCKNSTLLDSSKAENIDVIAQPSNLSEILEQTGNVIREGSFNRDYSSDGAEVHESSRPVTITVAGKTISKLQAATEITLEQKRIHSVSLPMKHKKPMNEEPSSKQATKCKKKVNFADPLKIEYASEFSRIKPLSTLSTEFPFQLERQVLQQNVETNEKRKPIQTSTPLQTFEQSTRMEQQGEVPICSIILAPVCYRPSKVWQCEHVQPWAPFENAPIDIIIELSK
ncbi:meiosis-specific kinetochore protein-like [Heptranchias perlo]|uniref:meiosis-specific kinetochore protein-like n=1 Tax=Heptranchias perlo TaxID=212740 RepID=UPI00355AB817